MAGANIKIRKGLHAFPKPERRNAIEQERIKRLNAQFEFAADSLKSKSEYPEIFHELQINTLGSIMDSIKLGRHFEKQWLLNNGLQLGVFNDALEENKKPPMKKNDLQAYYMKMQTNYQKR